MNKKGRARKVKYDLTPRPSPPADVGSEGAKYVILCFLLQLTMVSKQLSLQILTPVSHAL